MNQSEVQQGSLRVYGGFLWKQWRRRFVLLTAEGTLLVCPDSASSPEQQVQLQSGCDAIVEGKDILDLPRLPPGGERESCFALILPHHKFLLLLADAPSASSQWVNVLKKVKMSVSSPLSPCRRHPHPPHITLRDLVPEHITDKDPPTPPISDPESNSPGARSCSSPRERGRSSPRSKLPKGVGPSVGCLRHGTISNAQAMKAVYLLMGGAAASSAMGYLGACSPANMDAGGPELPANPDFSSLGPTGPFHSAGSALDSPHYNSFDFEVADSDFDAFDCGGFTF